VAPASKVVHWLNIWRSRILHVAVPLPRLERARTNARNSVCRHWLPVFQIMLSWRTPRLTPTSERCQPGVFEHVPKTGLARRGTLLAVGTRKPNFPGLCQAGSEDRDPAR
jgi:hypothetical protein